MRRVFANADVFTARDMLEAARFLEAVTGLNTY